MEKILFRRRMIKAGIAWVIVNIVHIVACYSNLLTMFKDGIIDDKAFNETIVTGDFHSVLQYGVVYMFIFLLYIEYIMGGSNIGIIIRYEKRRKYFYEQMKRVFVLVLEFVFIHEITSIIYVFLFGNYSILIQHNWLEGIAFQIIVSFLYYLLTYFVLTMISTKWKRNGAIVFTTIAMALQYYISTKILEFIYMPVKDAGIIVDICLGNYSYVSCFIVVFRLLIITVILGNMCLKMKDMEDIL